MRKHLGAGVSPSASDRAALCDGKEPFDSPNIGRAALKRIQRRKGAGGAHLYRCNYCGKWHVGMRMRNQS